jgi:hypothetical protein
MIQEEMVEGFQCLEEDSRGRNDEAIQGLATEAREGSQVRREGGLVPGKMELQCSVNSFTITLVSNGEGFVFLDGVIAAIMRTENETCFFQMGKLGKIRIQQKSALTRLVSIIGA